MAKSRSTKPSAVGGVFHELRQCDKQDSDAFAWRARGALDDINKLKGNLGNTPSFSLEGAGEQLSMYPKKIDPNNVRIPFHIKRG